MDDLRVQTSLVCIEDIDMNTRKLDISGVAHESSEIVHLGLAKYTTIPIPPELKPAGHAETMVDITKIPLVGNDIESFMESILTDACREAKRLYRYNGTWETVYVVVLKWDYESWMMKITADLYTVNMT